MKAFALAFLPLTLALLAADSPVPAKPEYNRDVRPILADACFRCHGFDKNTREADLRLDVREAALAKIDDIFPIVPGKIAESEVWRRITSTDKDGLMPPPKEHRQLSAREKEVLKRWIEQGAEYHAHWAYIAPSKPAVPKLRNVDFGFRSGEQPNPIDAFVVARQRSLGLIIRTVNQLNAKRDAVVDDPEIATRIAQDEMVFRMQASVPEPTDVSREPQSTLDLYGCTPGDGTFASNCLLARRLAERGVRFIQLYHKDWDHHGGVKDGIQFKAAEIDRACMALIPDLKQRGMLDETLIVWAGEFGRTPMSQGGSGRDHHMLAFTAGSRVGKSKAACNGARLMNSATARWRTS